MRTLVRLRCRDCGYGVSARVAPVTCPMCRGTSWEHDAWRPFSGVLQNLAATQRGSTEKATAGLATKILSAGAAPGSRSSRGLERANT